MNRSCSIKITAYKIIRPALACLACAVFSGCAANSTYEIAPVSKDVYQKAQYKTITVQKGDMSPTVTLKLKARLADQIKYSIDITDAEVEEVFVNAGERVQKGQLLVSFASEKTEKAIEEYSSELEEKQLLLDHYTRMSMYDLQQRDYIVKEKKEYPLFQQQEDEIIADREREDLVRKYTDYSLTLEQLAEDVKVAGLFLQEEKQKLERCQLKAEEDGVITYISKGLLSGYAEPGSLLITETCGENVYEAYTDNDFDFQIGDVYQAERAGLVYDMKVSGIETEGEKNRVILFSPDETLLNPPEGDTLDMTIKKETLHNVVYVERSAVHSKDEKEFVYTLTPEGFLYPLYVETGEVVEDLVVIKSGLSGGEEVAIVQ